MCLISFIIHGLFQLSFPPPKTFLLTLTLSALVPGSSNVKRETGYTTVLNALIAAIKASSPRYAALLQLAADKASWGTPLPAGRAPGIAMQKSFDSIEAQVETHIVASNSHPAGVGEPAVPPIVPTLGNALFALTGKRQRALPLQA
jgi:CO/xanthine dehydrogenase Mo-binding subunit